MENLSVMALAYATCSDFASSLTYYATPEKNVNPERLMKNVQKTAEGA